MIHPFEYLAPKKLKDALKLLDEYAEDYKIICGGQSLLILMRQGLVAPAVVIDMKIISEFAPEPKLVQVYQASAHGTNLFNTEYGGQLTELLISFLEAIRSKSPLPTP